MTHTQGPGNTDYVLALVALAHHISAMADDAYMTGHPEWLEITREAHQALAMSTKEGA